MEVVKDGHMTKCIRAYQFYLVGCIRYTDKSQQYIDVLYVEYLWDLTAVN
jgi:hypothetical protein